ncbi:hypothetical protein H5410_009853 [Solanum commersonii]|uniref:Uncharacterized protein n=1 Tax=Solanum commersonii TaxID=4109 RepID=A0A9J6AJY3_SOLCO|nr:hypothetical protein H5410_009853 [Solanum commersonii]
MWNKYCKDKGHIGGRKEDLKFAKLCYKLGISLIKRSGGNLEKDILLCGLISGHNWEALLVLKEEIKHGGCLVVMAGYCNNSLLKLSLIHLSIVLELNLFGKLLEIFAWLSFPINQTSIDYGRLVESDGNFLPLIVETELQLMARESYTWSMRGPMADSLGYGHIRTMIRSHGVEELPQHAKAILQQDKEKTPNLRIRNKHYNAMQGRRLVDLNSGINPSGVQPVEENNQGLMRFVDVEVIATHTWIDIEHSSYQEEVSIWKVWSSLWEDSPATVTSEKLKFFSDIRVYYPFC